MQKNVASQKCWFYAYNVTTGLPVTGDGANQTPYVSKDFGPVTVLGTATMNEADSTNAKGYYYAALAQAETNADTLMFSAKSSTANVVLVGAPAVVFTTPPNFNLESIDSNGRLDIIKVNGTSQTARDLGGQLDATVSSRMATYTQPTGFLAATFPSGTLANTTNITAGTITTVTTLTNLPAIPANWLTAAGIAAAALNGKGDWSTYAGGDTAGTTTLLSRISKAFVYDSNNLPQVDLVDIAGTASAGAPGYVGVSLLYDSTNLLTRYILFAGGGGFVTFPTAGTIAKLNDQMDLVNAPNATAVTAIQAGLATAANLATANTNIASLQMQIGTAGAGLTALGDTRIAHLNADMTSRMATYTQPTGFLAATFPSGTIANTTNITAGTITTTTNLTTNNDKTGYTLSATGSDAVLVDGKTLRAALQIIAAMVGGLVSGAGSGTETFVGLDGATTRATITVDVNGNRTGAVYG